MQNHLQWLIYQPKMPTPLGTLRLGFANDVLCALEMGADESPVSPFLPSANTQAAFAWLDAYFSGDFSRQALPPLPVMHLAGTPFAQRVWAALAEIKPGERITYGELARKLATSPRALGGALKRNPLPLFVPCHRVVAAQGLGGYAGASELGQQRKRWLLAHET